MPLQVFEIDVAQLMSANELLQGSSEWQEWYRCQHSKTPTVSPTHQSNNSSTPTPHDATLAPTSSPISAPLSSNNSKDLEIDCSGTPNHATPNLKSVAALTCWCLYWLSYMFGLY